MDSEKGPSLNSFLSLIDHTSSKKDLLVVGNIEEEHYHYDPVQEFYNQCHGPDGKFCPGTGSGSGGGTEAKTKGKTVSKEPLNSKVATTSKGSSSKGGSSKGVTGKAELPDEDGAVPITQVPEKRGPKGGSLVDPNDGTRTIAGLAGYDERGKPVPGSNAWLEAHGVSKEIYASRPYVKYEADRNDPALKEAFQEYPKADSFFRQRAEQADQTGGLIMYKHQVPGSPWGPVAPQVRPNVQVVTNAAKRSYAKKVLENDIERLATVKKTTPSALRAERRAQLKQAEINLERTKTATPEKVRAEAIKNLEKAQGAVKKAKEGGNPTSILEAKQELITVKRQHDKDLKEANKWDPEKQLYDAELRVKYAQNRLQKSITDPKAALTAEIKSQEGAVKRSENRFDKTAAKYVFSPGTSSARIDMNQDPQNVRNLVHGKGRIYFAMEGSIKNDAILTSLKKEDPTATVVNVPSVTLWQQKAGLPGEAAGEVMWFAGKYGKGREIVLIPDADGITNPNVMMQAKALSTSLRANGAGAVIVASPPLKAGTKRVVDHFNLPSGVDEGRKGIDDHLGAGRGTLGQLQYTHITKVPSYDLKEYTKAAGGEGPKVNRNSIKNTEAALAAISGIAGPDGITKLPKKMLAQTSGLPLTSAKEARDRLVGLGIISVEHVFDEQALSRGRRIRNPKVSDERVDELVRLKVIKQPRLDQPFTEVTIDESPVVTILDPRFRIKHENVRVGTLSDLQTWSQPKNFKGWTSAVDGSPDKTGIAAKQAQQAAKSIAKKAANAPAAIKVAPEGRRIVRSKAGAKKYGVPIGQLIPVASTNKIISLTLLLDKVDENLIDSVLSEESLMEFYNTCHGPDGKFCPTPGGSGSGKGGSGKGGSGKGVSGRASISKASVSKGVSGKGVSGKSTPGNSAKGWPASKGRPITTVAKAGIGSVTVDGIKAKAVYEVKATNGNRIRLYDKTGDVGHYKDALLQNQARMSEMYPLRPPRNIVVTRPGFRSDVTKNDFSIVHSNKNPTFVNSELLGFDLKGLKPGFLMPSAQTGNTTNMNYLMTHEYGHQIDFSRHVTGDKHTASPLVRDPAFRNALSRYGKNDAVEAYAETFAEWHYTRGRTQNPAAVAMARSEGWFGSEVTASGVLSNNTSLEDLSNDSSSEHPSNGLASGGIVSKNGLVMVSETGYLDITSTVNYGLVQFNDGFYIDDLLSFEGKLFFQTEEDDSKVTSEDSDKDILEDDIPADGTGVTVIDNYVTGSKFSGKTKQPSKEEVAKATELIKEVFKDLGLDYDAYAKGEIE